MWQVIRSSVRGTSHERNGTNCQDAHGYKFIGDGCVVAVVADGLGSAPKSENGARIAVDTTLKTLSLFLEKEIPSTPVTWREIIEQGFSKAIEAIQEVAGQEQTSIKEYATTLLIAIITENWIATGHIGDGAIVVGREDGSLEMISAPQRGEFANEVVPLTASKVMSRVQLVAENIQIASVALLSDGLQSLAIDYSTNTPHKGFFAPFFKILSEPIDTEKISSKLEEFLKSEKVCTKTDDDKTLVVIGKITPERERVSDILPENTQPESEPSQLESETGEKGRVNGMFEKMMDFLRFRKANARTDTRYTPR